MMRPGGAALDRAAISFLLAGSVAGFAAACSDDGTGPSGPDVASVTVMAASATLESVDETVQLQATALDPAGGALSGVTFEWSSSAPDVADVDENGLVTARGNGQAEITAAAGGVEGGLTITVSQVATQIVFSAPPENHSVNVPFAQLEVEAIDANGHVATNFSDPVTISIGVNPIGGALTGQFSRSAMNGAAAFPGLALDEPGAGYTLVAQAGALSVESDPFNVTRRGVYVAHGLGQSLTFFDLGADTVGTVATGGGPASIAITPDGLYAYVVNRTADSVAVIETSGNTVVTTMAVGALSQFIRISPDGRVAYATSSNDGTMAVISTASNTVVETVDVGGFALGIAFTPDSEFAYVVARSDDSVAVVSTRTHSVVRRIGVDDGPVDVAVNPDGSLVYVTINNTASVTLISTATNTIVGNVPVGGGPTQIAFTPDGSAAFVANEDDDTVSRIDTSTNTAPTTIPVGDRPLGLAVTPDGDFVYVANALGPSVSVIDVSTNTAITTIPVATTPLDFGVMPLPVP